MALNGLNTTYDIANTQLDAAKKSSKFAGYFTAYYSYLKKKDNTTDAAAIPTTAAKQSGEYPPNGVLRAHVLKAECCLQIAILQLLQESVMGYVKCGLNLRRAYSSYSYVWQEYQKMGADHSAFMDSDTISGVQFGIGSVHLVLSALPAKILKAVSAFGWKPDKQLGFILLNQCAASGRVRSSMATIMLMAYYTAAISFAPQILSSVYRKTAMNVSVFFFCKQISVLTYVLRFFWTLKKIIPILPSIYSLQVVWLVMPSTCHYQHSLSFMLLKSVGVNGQK